MRSAPTWMCELEARRIQWDVLRTELTGRRNAPHRHVRTLVAGFALAAVALLTSWTVESRPVVQPQPQPLPPFQQFVAEVRPGLLSDRLLQVHYAFEERQTRYRHDASGKVIETIDTIIEWYPALEEELDYERVVSINGKRVASADLDRRDRQHEKKVRDWAARVRRSGSTPADWRRSKEAIEHVKERGLVDELFLLYEIRMLHRELIGGRPAIAFSLVPRPGFQPRHPDAQLARHFGGRVWIDEADRQFVRLEMEALDDVSLALGFVARLNKGSRAEFDRSRSEDGTWLPSHAHFVAGGRVLLVKRIELDQVSEYRNYKPQAIDRIPFLGDVPKAESAPGLAAALRTFAVGQ